MMDLVLRQRDPDSPTRGLLRKKFNFDSNFGKLEHVRIDSVFRILVCRLDLVGVVTFWLGPSLGSLL